MAPFSLVPVGASLLLKSVGLISSTSFLRCSFAAPLIRSFSSSSAAGPPPKRPLTAYMKYVQEMQPTVCRLNPGVKNVDIVRKIAQQWRVLSSEQKRPFQDASLVARQQYKLDLETYKAKLTPGQSAAIAEEKRQKLAKRKAIRKKKELNNLGKPKRPRSSFNIFMAEHFEEARGTTMPAKMKSLTDDWKNLNITQKRIYTQLAEDDKVRYKNEIKSWEEHMSEIGRDDLVRRKERRSVKGTTKTRKKAQSTATKAKAPVKTTKTAAKKTVKSSKK